MTKKSSQDLQFEPTTPLGDAAEGPGSGYLDMKDEEQASHEGPQRNQPFHRGAVVLKAKPPSKTLLADEEVQAESYNKLFGKLFQDETGKVKSEARL